MSFGVEELALTAVIGVGLLLLGRRWPRLRRRSRGLWKPFPLLYFLGMLALFGAHTLPADGRGQEIVDAVAVVLMLAGAIVEWRRGTSATPPADV
ncbi:MAG: hypothetical protein ACE5IK_08755 [Acidobacteriota bacterium]